MPSLFWVHQVYLSSASVSQVKSFSSQKHGFVKKGEILQSLKVEVKQLPSLNKNEVYFFKLVPLKFV